ncbi:MAG: hypothetical protein AB7N76_24140 [Planctomycetota bacterium]
MSDPGPFHVGAPPARAELRALRAALSLGVAAAAAVAATIAAVTPQGARALVGGAQTPHGELGLRCEACHTRAWEGARHALEGGDAWRNATCRECHGEVATSAAGQPVHHRGVLGPACSQCHPEHGRHAPGERDALRAVPAQRCVACHRERGLRAWEAGHPDWTPRDAGGLRFSHADHAKRGVACARCHPPQGGGFAPLSFERHCAECHPLPAGGAWPASGVAPAGAVPHAAPARVRAFVAALGGDVAAVDSALYGRGGACARCHGETREPRGAGGGWLPRARFDHRAHTRRPASGELLACGACHAAERSQAASDVLVPARATCLECHRTPRKPSERPGAAPVRCSLCHDFHTRAR